MKEKELIKQCQRGDREAFDALIRLFYPYVSNYLLKMTLDQTLAEDLTQETFLKMIRSIDRYRVNGKASFGTYLITIAKNSYIDYCRRKRPVFAREMELEPDGDNMEERILAKLDYEAFMRHMEALPLNQQRAIKLKYVDELTLKEIASLTGVPEKPVKSRIHEGTKKLRKLLGLQKGGTI